MKQDIREKTCLIIRKGKEYLVARVVWSSSELKWSTSAWEAWSTRSREKAEKVAELTGGEIMMFNPIIGRVQKYEPAVPAEYEGDARTTWWYVCGECHAAINWKDKRCKSCGRRISWEGWSNETGGKNGRV